jgi:hypothetical protein
LDVSRFGFRGELIIPQAAQATPKDKIAQTKRNLRNRFPVYAKML